MTSLLNKQLSLASKYGNPAKLRQLLEQGANPYFIDSNGYTPLVNAILNSNLENIRFLINEAEVDINQCGFNNYAPVHAAADKEDRFTLDLLIATNNLDINALCIYVTELFELTMSALDIAKHHCNGEIINVLEKNGAKQVLSLDDEGKRYSRISPTF